MAGHKRIHSVAYTAGQDLSAYQYRVVSIAADAEVDPTENGNTPPLGVLLNKPNAQGTEAEVAIEGSDVKLVAAAAINEGELVLASAGGMGTPGPSGGTAVGTTWVVGICTQAASGSGAIAGVLLRPFFYVRA